MKELKMKEPSIKKNLLLSTAYQVLTMLTPLITTPYISRVLGVGGIGIYSYTYSIESYFSMFAALGTVSYGSREIARNRNDRKRYSLLFWEVELLTILTTSVCLILWGILVAISTKYKLYYTILSFYLIATMFDISWLYAGIEQFRYTVVQNSIFKLLGIIALFIFVKDKSHVAVYTLIMSLSMLLGNLSMWIYLPKFIDKVQLKNIHLMHHIKEILIYFIPTIATSIYTVLDKTLIGAITQNSNENGYYEQATRIINMAKSVTFSGLNSVLGARISYLYAEKKFGEIKEKIDISIDYILFMGIGIIFGIFGVSERFVPLFFGDGFKKAGQLLKLLCPAVVIIGISNCLGAQYYTPAGLRKQSAKYIIIGSLVNLIFNVIFISRYASYGAVIATLIAELTITILYLKNCNRIITVTELCHHAWKKIISGVLMLGVISAVGHINMNKIVVLGLQVLCGGICYFLGLLVLRDTFMNFIIKLTRKRAAR